MARLREIAAGLIRLDSAGWRDLLAAEAALVAAQLTVWLRPRGQLVRRVPSGEGVPPAGRVEPAIDALVAAIDRVARYGPIRPQCLVRALALSRLLEQRGYGDCRVRVGVRKQGAELIAHAWVEHGGAVIGEAGRDVSQFVVLSEVEVRR